MMNDFAMPDTIFIQGLKVQAIIGVYAHEKTRHQPLLIDLSMTSDTLKASQSDDLSHTVDYAGVAEALTGFIAETRFELLEALAGAAMDFLFQTFPVGRIRLRIAKPEAIPAALAAGIEIERVRP